MELQPKIGISMYDGYTLPPFPKILQDVNKCMTDIINMKCLQDDILICAYPRSGTNWIYEIITMLIRGSATHALVHKFRSGMLENVSLYEILDQKYPRILNTHIPFRHLPKQHLQEGSKIVHVIRNPKDVCVSLFCFKKNIAEWSEKYPTTWPDFLETVFTDKQKLYGGWFNYENEFEKAIETKACTNVHTLYYEDMKQNPIEEINRLAKYLNYPHTAELIEEIARKTSFANLSKAANEKKDIAEIRSRSTTQKNYLFRKGTVGDWKNWFTVAQNERMDDFIKNEMKNSKLKFTYEL